MPCRSREEVMTNGYVCRGLTGSRGDTWWVHFRFC